jgi:hypothetical protein
MRRTTSTPTRRLPVPSPRKPYYRYDVVSDTVCTADLPWVARAIAFQGPLSALKARLEAGEVFTSRWARFAVQAESLIPRTPTRNLAVQH